MRTAVIGWLRERLRYAHHDERGALSLEWVVIAVISVALAGIVGGTILKAGLVEVEHLRVAAAQDCEAARGGKWNETAESCSFEARITAGECWTDGVGWAKCAPPTRAVVEVPTPDKEEPADDEGRPDYDLTNWPISAVEQGSCYFPALSGAHITNEGADMTLEMRFAPTPGAAQRCSDTLFRLGGSQWAGTVSGAEAICKQEHGAGAWSLRIVAQDESSQWRGYSPNLSGAGFCTVPST